MNFEILCSFIFFSFPTGAATPRTGVETPRQIGMVNGGGPQSKPCQITGGSSVSNTIVRMHIRLKSRFYVIIL